MGTAISCICLGGFGVNFINRVYTYNKDIKFISINDDTHHKCMATIKLNSWKKIIDLIKNLSEWMIYKDSGLIID